MAADLSVVLIRGSTIPFILVHNERIATIDERVRPAFASLKKPSGPPGVVSVRQLGPARSSVFTGAAKR